MDGEGVRGGRERKASPVEVNSLLGELALSVRGVVVRLVLHHLHALAAVALLVAVLADHVQLPNPVLRGQRNATRIRPAGVLHRRQRRKRGLALTNDFGYCFL